MVEWALLIASAFWLGVLTSISPCPLATNIAAISFVGRRVDKPASVLSAGLLYTAGRSLTYMALGILLVSSILSAPRVSLTLQKYMNMLLGPLLIIIGMVLLDLISLNIRGPGIGESIKKKAEFLGIWGAGLLGIVFALSFCPTSAALFFGSLLPLAVKNNSKILLPAIYGLATGLPVLLFAVLLALGANRVAQAYNKIVLFEKWGRKITGILFIIIGIYYCLTHIFHLQF
ncbi:MAG TPA: aromatic aminobenezylarsenical efflux permease ArsG family transporter [Candidatus Krumholzibacteriaceae bacterium]|nr:aromatic aminobenezylarsenical efflux permease ArsG family transporter [Candidatus Krumholzibacteriaceae bacterium]